MRGTIEHSLQQLVSIKLQRELLEREGHIASRRQNRWRNLFQRNGRRRTPLGLLSCSGAGIPRHGPLRNKAILMLPLPVQLVGGMPQ